VGEPPNDSLVSQAAPGSSGAQQARITQKLITSLLGFESGTGWLYCASANGTTLISIREGRFRGRSRIWKSRSETGLTELIAVTSATAAAPGASGARLNLTSRTKAENVCGDGRRRPVTAWRAMARTAPAPGVRPRPLHDSTLAL